MLGTMERRSWTRKKPCGRLAFRMHLAFCAETMTPVVQAGILRQIASL